MHLINTFLDFVRDTMKAQVMRPIARGLNSISNGRLNPSVITFVGLFMHVFIALAIARGYFGYAAGLLVVFGLFDALDGELARLQKRAGPIGMLLDSVTDRMKEVMLYVGIGYIFIVMNQSYYAVWAIAACGGSLLVSYVNAWGDVIAERFKSKSHTVNKSFRGSLMRFEVRMFMLVVALLFSRLDIAIVIIAILVWFTAVERLRGVIKSLNV